MSTPLVGHPWASADSLPRGSSKWKRSPAWKARMRKQRREGSEPALLCQGNKQSFFLFFPSPPSVRLRLS